MWQTPVKTIRGTGMEANPVGIDGVIYYAVMSSVYAVDAHTGRILWNYTACSGDCIVQNLLVKQNTLYMQINSNSLSLLALNLANRSVLWSKNYGLAWALGQGLIYIAFDPNYVKVLDANNGKVLKSYTGSGTIYGITPQP
jgi:outer membrane protein assembly factor BamB